MFGLISAKSAWPEAKRGLDDPLTGAKGDSDRRRRAPSGSGAESSGSYRASGGGLQGCPAGRRAAFGGSMAQHVGPPML